MERVVTPYIEKLPEGVYPATSDEIQGLVAQGRTIQETIEIARDIAKKLIESQFGEDWSISFPSVREEFNYPMIVSA